MKIKDGFKLRTVMGSSVVIAEGAHQFDFNKLISLNESAAMLWHKAAGHDFSTAELADALVEEYGIDAETANADAAEVVKQWIEIGLVEQ